MDTTTVFILLAAILVLLALAFLIYALGKTQKPTAIFLAIAMPLATVGLYLLVGNPNAINAAKQIANTDDTAPPDIATAIAQLEEELKSNPSNLEGWLLLARSYMAMENYQPALAAFQKARDISPDDSDIKSEHAEAMLRASGEREFSAEALALLEESAAANPDNQRALFFLGMHYLQQGDGAKAEEYLQRLLPKLDADAATALMQQINIAREQQNKPPLASSASKEAVTANEPGINIKVDIDSNLIGEIKPNAVLFVFAKTADGVGPPVAAKRIEVNGFPIKVSLSDNDSLMPTAKFSSQEKVQLVARISHNGIANPQSGDIEADAVISSTTNPDAVRLRLSRVRP